METSNKPATVKPLSSAELAELTRKRAAKQAQLAALQQELETEDHQHAEAISAGLTALIVGLPAQMGLPDLKTVRAYVDSVIKLGALPANPGERKERVSLTLAQKLEVASDRKAGKTIAETSAKFDVSAGTVNNIVTDIAKTIAEAKAAKIPVPAALLATGRVDKAQTPPK